MRKKLVLGLAAAMAALAVGILPGWAVQFGEPDGGGHPYVGLVVFYADAAATQPLWRCTGTLVDEETFLTAGHCTGDPVTPPVRAQVWFDPNIVTDTDPAPPVGYPLGGGVMGTPIPHPQWNGALTIPNTHDVGVVELDTPRAGPYGQIASAGTLDSLLKRRGLQNVTFKVVGYGLQGVKPEFMSAKTRMVGWTRVVNLRSALTDGYNIQLSSNPGHWTGGTCFGDSGGPVFLGDSDIIVAVNSFVLNENCKGSGFGFRVDTATAQDFLEDYVTLP